MTGRTLFLAKKMTERIFFIRIHKQFLLLLMLSCLTLDAECFVSLDIAQFADSHNTVELRE